MLASQFATLEPLAPDENGVVIDVDQDIDAIVQGYVDRTAMVSTSSTNDDQTNGQFNDDQSSINENQKES